VERSFVASRRRAKQTPRRKRAIGRAPVLTLLAEFVAERLGFQRNEALTFGRTVARANAPW